MLLYAFSVLIPAIASFKQTYCLTRTLFATTFLLRSTMATFSSSTQPNHTPVNEEIDHQYPGTAVMRMTEARNRIRSLTYDQLNGDWEDVRRNLLWAGGLRDLVNVPPGQGYTGHSFNDFNHCDLTAMQEEVTDADNEGRVPGIATHNPLGQYRSNAHFSSSHI